VADINVELVAPGDLLSAGATPIGAATADGVGVRISHEDGKTAYILLSPAEAITLGGSIYKAGRTARRNERDR
jgi:hypothetical protein